jgi:hypothetical protein
LDGRESAPAERTEPSAATIPAEPVFGARNGTPEVHSETSFPPERELDRSEPGPAVVEGAAQPAPTGGPDLTAAPTDVSRSESPGPAANGAPERTAEIYVLRQAHGGASKVVPIRPGALDSPAPVESGASGSGESIELSNSERDAFREIARALGGRPGPARVEAGGDGSDAAQERSRAPNAKDKPDGSAPHVSGAPVESAGPLSRNAAGILDRLPIGVMFARDARALYLNHTLLDLLGYRDFAHFDASNGLMTMFEGRDPRAISASDSGAVPIRRADGRPVAVDGHAQAVTWDGLPATLIAFRRLREAEVQDQRPVAERARAGAARPTRCRRCSIMRPMAPSRLIRPGGSCPSIDLRRSCSATGRGRLSARAF